MIIGVKKLHEKARVPTKATSGSNGYDLYSADFGEGGFGVVHIPARSHSVVSTGIALDFPTGVFGMITPRSGLAAKHGVTVLNSPGLIDTDYKGEIKVILANHTDEEYQVRVGDRIAQLVLFHETESFAIEEVATFFENTERGANGFGSSGK